MEPDAGIQRYCRRLAGIYKSEESIGGLPINMEGFCLFDATHRSSRPLCLAYKAAQLASPEKADALSTSQSGFLSSVDSLRRHLQPQYKEKLYPAL